MYPLPIGYKIGAKDNRADGYLIPEVRSRHTALFGKSGVGKTTLMRNMILWDIGNGSGVTVIGDPNYANSNAMEAPGGPYSGNKCNVFVGMAVSTAASAKIGSAKGYPMSDGKFPSANHLGDSRDTQRLANLPVVGDGSLRIGDIVAYRHSNAASNNLGHATVYIGGGAVVYAGGSGGGIPRADTLKAMDSAMNNLAER